MVKLTILYQRPSDPEKFDAHYFGTHMPLAAKLPGLVRAEAAKITGGLDGSPAPYYVHTDLVFETKDALMGSFGTPEGQAVGGDMVNFEAEGMIMFVSEIAYP